MRKRIAMLLAVCVAASMVIYPSGIGTVRAAEVQGTEDAQNTAEDFEYEELANGTVKITKYKGSGTEVVIPSAINGKTVAILEEELFLGCSNLQSITIPSGVTNIGGSYTYSEAYVFEGCSGLEEIIVDSENAWYSSKDGLLYNREMTELLVCPAAKAGGVAVEDGITVINTKAFQNCSRLTRITLPSSITSVNQNEYGYFDGCSSLEEIIVDASNGLYCSQDGILYKKETDIFGDENGRILMCCPAGKKGTVAIPDGVIGIGECAFRDCSSLEEIIIPDGLKSIGLSAFQNCSSLTGITIPKSVSRIDVWDAWREMYKSIFQDCSSLMEITVDEENESYASSDGMLYTKDLTSLICCPAGKAGEIAVPDGVVSINGTAFDDCNSLTKITIPQSVSGLSVPGEDNGRSMTFGRCSSLEEIIVDPYNRTYSSLDGMLYSKDMSQLLCCPPGKKGEVAIPDGVQEIIEFTFYNCGSLTGIWIPNSVNKIGEDDSSSVFTGCNNLTEIKVEDGCESYFSVDGILYSLYRRRVYLICCPVRIEGDIKIPENLNRIGGNDFRNCTNLKNVEVSEYVQIEEGAFAGCGNDLCIICIEGSKAEAYAIENGINYKAIKKKPQLINASDFTKTLGDTPFPINAVLDGEGELYYESSNDSVASVSPDGIVTVNGVGTAEITIIAEETGFYASAQKVITITVSPK